VVFGLAFFAFTYSPYSHLWFYAPDTMADRYMFIPSLGLAVVFVDGAARLAGVDLRRPSLRTARARAVTALLAATTAAFFARTIWASRDWRNDATLIHNRIRYMQDGAAAQAIYGHTLMKEGYEASDPAVRSARRAAAMQAFTRAIQIYPDFQAAWIAVGKLFAEQQIYEKAELAFFKAQRLEPLNPDAYFCLGTLYLAQRDPQLAIPYLEKAVLLDPRMEDAYVMLGKAYLQADDIENLGAMAKTAHEWFPENPDLGALLATYHFRNRDYKQAADLARAVLARDGTNILALAIVGSPLTQEFVKWGGS
jgi:cytochrome c-type biogenesis protein CcmH/NrfG